MSAPILPLTGLQRPVFLINSRLGKFNCGPDLHQGETSRELTSSFFAEFLNEGSPVHLRLLASSTCVGFGTDTIALILEAFPGTLLHFVSPTEVENSAIARI